jgi:hypothetical protein
MNTVMSPKIYAPNPLMIETDCATSKMFVALFRLDRLYDIIDPSSLTRLILFQILTRSQ